MTAVSPKIVICGAGIAGIAAAYALTVTYGQRDVILVEQDNPLSLTSDKSTEAYRNWWPGPDAAMTAFMNRSIDLIEAIARKTANRINLNRRGYLFATADRAKIDWLADMARAAEVHGGGPLRVHASATSAYIPSPRSGFDLPLTGADLITSPELIRRHFPYLALETVAVAHARRAGWLSAQQLGMTMLEAARDQGVSLRRGRVTGFDTTGGRVRGVQIEQQGVRQILDATHVVLAGGPMQKDLAALIGVELPIFAERHLKISLPDTRGVVPGDAPMLIWLDEQSLPWSAEERDALTESEETGWLLDKFPWGVHGRPDGTGERSTLLMLFNYHSTPTEVVFPLPEEDHYPEITLRGMSTMVPALAAYLESGVRPYVDGGYYMKTRENRPLIGPLPVAGAYISGAYSGFGIMASCAGGELIAQHILGSPLPDYAPAFLLSRYQDADYCRLLASWGDGGQL